MGGKPENGVLDQGRSGVIIMKSGSNWSAVGLAGEAGENAEKVFVLPSGSDFNDSSDRRRDVKYDYLDCDGNKVKNVLNATVTTYDIADNFAKGTWCRNIVMPKEVTTIGENAFSGAHVTYLETYATNIGAMAFKDDDTVKDVQWFYFHQTKNSSGNYVAYTFGSSDTFSAPQSGRHIIFSNYELYNTVKLATTSETGYNNLKTSATIHYQIPVVANVDNKDADEYTYGGSDIPDRFFNDPDYNADVFDDDGNVIVAASKSTSATYTKRLSGYNFTYVKQYTGSWAINSTLANAQSEPTLSNMTETKWYSTAGYASATNASTVYTNGTFDSNNAKAQIYTKNIARPQNIYNGEYDGVYKGEYTFGETYTFAGVDKTLGDAATECIDYYTALGLSNDYSITLDKFTYAGGTIDGTTATTTLHNAGSYSFSINLASKWGKWKPEYIAANAQYFTASATIARKTLDYSTIDKLPLFVNASNGGKYALNGERTPLYKYNDGWYAAQQGEDEPNDTKTVTNSYCYFADKDVTIKMAGENVSADGNTSTLDDVVIESRNGVTFKNTGDYTASFTFRVKTIPNTTQSNYLFYYGDNEETMYNNVTDATLGISMISKQDNTFRITKKWYIVIETNMFVISGSTTPYTPVAEDEIYYSDGLTLNLPALRYGHAANKIDFEIDYTAVNSSRAVNIVERTTTDEATPASTIEYYINSSMPAGTYTLRLYGAATTATDTGKSYPAISGVYSVEVLPKALDSTGVNAIDTALKGTTTAVIDGVTVTANAYPDTARKLHDTYKVGDNALGDINETLPLSEINGTLNPAARSGYWALEDNDKYYDSAVTLAYNLEGSGNTTYVNYATTLGLLVTAKEYQLYYSISAKNYEMYGGEGDADRRDKTFYTVIYTDMKVSQVYTQYIVDVTSPYFKNVVYSGSEEHTLVPSSQYYQPFFTDTNYVDVRAKATVTLKLYNTQLAKWTLDYNETFTEAEAGRYFDIVGNDLVVYFDIVAAQNNWAVTPQMPSWTFNGFDEDVNFITAGLAFAGLTLGGNTYAPEVKYALIPDGYDALDVAYGDADAVSAGAVFFDVAGGKVDADTAILLNALKPGKYYLKSYISDLYSDGATTAAEDGANVVDVCGFSYIAKNAAGEYITTVTVSRATNSWASTPNVMRWTFGDYDRDTNSITAVPVYPDLKPQYKDTDALSDFVYTGAAAKVSFTVYQKGVNGAADKQLFAFAAGDDVSGRLMGLHAGTYVLATSFGGSDYYLPIAETKMDFTIGRAVNVWTTTPQVVQWTWGEYSATKNVISAATKFYGGDGTPDSVDSPIVFSVLDADREPVAVTLADGKSVTLEEFEINEQGMIKNADMAAAFAALNAGSYYLRAFKDGNNDYTAITADDNTDIPFTVGMANNSWTTSPGMTSWQYKTFTSDNFRMGVPKYENTTSPATYTLTKKAGGAFTFGGSEAESFTLGFTASGELTEGMINAFTALAVGEYTITVAQAETNDFGPLSYDVNFSVIKTSNSWDADPGIKSWSYKGFTASLFTAGTPSLKEVEGAVVTYTVYVKGTSTVVVSLEQENGALTAATVTALENLAVGNYTLTAAYVGTDNYGPLSRNIDFDVTKANNSWETAPGMIGWTYGSYRDSLFTAGEPTLKESKDGDADAKVVYTLYKTVDAVDTQVKTFTTLAEAGFATLAAGDYAIVASYAGTDNYYALTSERVTFSVGKYTNTWNPSPVLRGWNYKGFTSSLFTAGKPARMESVDDNGDEADVIYVVKGGKLAATGLTLEVDENGVLSSTSVTALTDLEVGSYTLTVSYIGTDNYDAISATVLFDVGKYTNTWNPSPVLRGWNYKGFTSSLFTAGKPARMESVDDNGDEADVIYVVKGGKLAATGLTLEVDENGVLSSTSVTALTDLEVGSYTLTVSYVGTDNYDAISATVLFDVGKYTNTWNPSPVLRGWNYKGFTSSLFTAGVPARMESTVEGEDGTTVAATVTYVVTGGVLDAAGLTLTVSGGALSAGSIADLTALGKGSYTLTATYIGTANYDTITATVTFEVGDIANTWATRPGMRGWTYGMFDASLFTAGVPALTESKDENGVAAKVEYTLYKLETSGAVEKKQFTELDVDYFKALDAGNYRIDVLYVGTDNYDDLTAEITFQVTPVANSWDKQPAIMGYIYTQFDASRNFIAGDPRYPLDSNTVYYIIGKAAYETVTTYDEFRALTEDEETYVTDFTTTIKARDITALNGLGYGTYYFAAFVPGANNYSYLFYSGSFSVSQTGNNWTITPDISGWTYGRFTSGLIHNGAAQYGTVKYTVRKVVDGNVVEGDDGIATAGGVSLSDMTYTALGNALADLDAGSYSLIAATDSNANYTAATFSKQFTVAKANNEWGTNPSISGWTFGGTASTPNNGAAKYESAAATVTGAYYLTTTVNGALAADMTKPVATVVNAGSYAYVLTVADTTNYNGFSSTLLFTVAQADNRWNTSPAGTYSWTWGDNISQKIANFVGANAIDGAVTFSVVGTTTTATVADIATVLGSLPVGDYTITAAVANSDNYTTVPMATAYVTVSRATFGITEPSCSGWTWGVADTSKVFNNIAVTTSKPGDVATITYRVSSDNGSTWTDATTDYTATLLPYLKNRPAGAYTVSIVVTCDNYTDVTRSVNFTISEATISWSGTAQNVSWDWDGNWTDTEGERVVPELTATDCAGNAITLTYTVNGSPFDSFDEMKVYLRSNERNAAVYTVKVTAQAPNHTADDKTYTVTVNVAVNAWTTEPDDSYRFEYQSWDEEGWQGVPAPAAKFGTVVCKYGDTTINNIDNWIKTLSASETAYVLTLTVDASENQYSRLYKEVRITVAGKGSSWYNYDALSKVTGATDTASSYSFVYTKTLFESLLDTVVLPLGNDTYGATTYSLTLDGTPVDNVSTLATLTAYLTDTTRTAGVYVVVARYEPKDNSFATLTYTVTVNVSKGSVGWSFKLNDSYSMIYGSVDLTDPAATEDFAEIDIVVTDKDGATLDMGGMKLSDFVKTLDVGEYKIASSIKASDNYTVTGDPSTCTLYITAIANAWQDTTVGDKTITAAEWNAGYTWTFTRGETISVMLPKFVTGTLEISFDGTPTTVKTIAELNALLNNNGKGRAAGEYILTFSVKATVNYNGLVSSCLVVVGKKDNTWTTLLATYTGSGSVDLSKFTMPVAQFGDANVDLRLFNIVKVGETSSEWYTYNTFVTKLAALEDGTFTVTVRMGGTAHAAALDEFKLALNAYNADYKEISCSCTVNLSPSTNSWTDKFVDVSWTWGETPTIVQPTAAFGNAKIVYTISGTDADDKAISVITIDSNDWNADVAVTKAYDALKAAIKALVPGRYTVTATIAATGLYAAPPDSNFAILTVSKYTASWKDYTDEQLAEYNLTSATWGAVASGFMPTLTVDTKNNHGEAVTSAVVEWRIGNEVLGATDNIITELNGKSAGTYVVTEKYAGDLYNESITFSATITIDPVATAWTDTTAAAIAEAANLSWIYGNVPASNLPAEFHIANWANKEDDLVFTQTKGGVTSNIDDWADYVSKLGELAYGSYRITVTLPGDGNHSTLTATFIIDVDRVDTAWSNKAAIDAAATQSWTYGLKGDKTLPTPVLDNWAEGTIVYSYTKDGGDAAPINDFATFVAGLNALGVGRYVITATVTGDANHTGISASFAIEVYAVVTAWTDNTVGDSIILGWTYSKKSDATTLPELKIANWDEGEIVYAVKVGNSTTTVTDWNDYISDPKLAAGTYVLTATVTGDGNHTGLLCTATVTVSKLDVAWSSATDAAEKAHSWTLGASDNSELVVPTLDADNKGDCTVTYTLVKVGASGSLYSGGDWSGDNSVLSALSAQKAGSYRITAKVSGDANCNLPADVTYTVTISAQANAWTEGTTKINVEWTYLAANNATIVFEPVYNKSLLTITVSGEPVTPVQLMSELNKLGYGTYAIVASVGANDEYAAPETISITLTVKRASNSLVGLAVSDWEWDDVSQKTSGWESAWDHFTAPVPTVGNSVIVTVRVKTSGVLASTATVEMTLTYLETVEDGVTVKKVNENDLNALKAKLLALGVLGENQVYTVQVEVPMSDNYESATTPVVEFNVTKATNDWDGANGTPHIQGWDFKGEIANPSSNPKFGKQTVRYTYATIRAGDEDDDVEEPLDPTAYEWLASTKTEAGMYWLRAIVPGTGNYSELVGYAKFSINAAPNGWTNDPSVIAWAWNGYDRNVNLFSGSARNNGTPTFKIFKGTTTNNSNLAATDFSVPAGVTLSPLTGGAVAYFSTTGFKLETVGDVKVVSAVAAQWLNALNPGKYVLHVYVPGGDSYDPLDKDVGFEIRPADNSWKVDGTAVKSPNVGNYYYGSPSFEEGEATYGTSNVRYAIIGNDNATNISGTDNAGITAATVENELKKLTAGSYTLRAWILGDGKTFNPRYSYGEPYTVTFTVNRAENGWDPAPQNVSANYSALHAKGADGEDNFYNNFKAMFGEPNAKDGAVKYRLLNADGVISGTDYLDYDGLIAALKSCVGEYSIESSVDATVKYAALAPVVTGVNIRRYTSMFGDGFPTQLTGKWGNNGTTSLTTDLSVITAAYGILGEDGKLTDSHAITAIKFELNGTSYDAEGFAGAVAALNAVTYQVTVFVDATNDYGAISRTIQLVIAPDDNGVDNNKGFKLETASKGDGTATVAETLVNSWKWSSTVSWQGAEPKYGNIVYVSVRTRGTTTDLRRFTIDYSDASLVQSALNTISEYISGLGAGNYTLFVETPADVNWNKSTDSFDFTVNKDDNGWKTDGEINKAPYITGSGCTIVDGKYVWTYGASASVVAGAVHGEIKYEFIGGSSTGVMPTDAGEYSVKISVPESDNFNGVAEITLYFKIEKKLEDHFMVLPGVTGWTWGQYRPTVNVFKGTPDVAQIEGATVTFAIGIGKGENFKVVSIGTTKLENIVLTDGLVDGDTAALIAQLTGGTKPEPEFNTTKYTLRLTVSSTTNYRGFDYDAEFEVAGAANGWIDPPAVTPWTASHWTEDDHMPSASSQYGIPEITIVNEFTQEVVFHGKYKEEHGTAFDEDAEDYVNELIRAGSGWYVMTTTVAADEGHYNNALTATYRFQIFIEGVDSDANYWKVDATISGWEANIDGIYSEFNAKPMYGLPNFTFYVANADGTPDLTRKVDKDTPGAVLIKKGNLYEEDIYVPMAPDNYVMVVTTKGVANASGEMIGALDNLGDDLTKGQARKVPFTIRPRALAFEDEPRIDTLLYLGDRANWAGPSVKTTIADADITFVYTDKETGELVSTNEMPNRTGKFILTTYASATYTLEISKPVEFTIELSPNSWVSAPNIKDWSEENDPNNPFGEASFGTEYIKYTYVNVKDPNKILTERPTTEGEYIMYADVDIEGYEPLHAEYRFTVEPAYDADLLIVDIVLGLVACAIAVVVIIFAVRRYKEN